MKQINVSNKALKHIICCFILLLVFVITYKKVNAQTISTVIDGESTEDVVPLKPQLDESLLETFICFILFSSPVEQSIYYHNYYGLSNLRLYQLMAKKKQSFVDCYIL